MNIATSPSHYERDETIPPVRIETYRGMRRRFQRREQPTTETPSARDLLLLTNRS